MNTRHALLALVLAATLAAAFWPMPEEDSQPAVATVERPPGRPVAGQAVPATAPIRLVPEVKADLFAAKAAPEPEAAPPEAAPEEEVAEAPVMPNFPYRYLGHWQEPGRDVYFLIQGSRSVQVRVGDVIDGVWQFQRATPAQLTLLYLPLQQETELRTAP